MTQPTSYLSLKRLLIIFASLAGVLLLALATLPLWFDVDHYRPQIISYAQKVIRGKINVGKLSLSAWGKLKVKVDGLELLDAENQKVIAAKSIHAEMPISSLFDAEPALTLTLERPQIFIVKYKNGQMNLVSLIRQETQPEQHGRQETSPTTAVKETKEKKPAPEGPLLPAFLIRSQLNLQLKKAQLSYLDQLTQQKNSLKDIDVEMMKVSLVNPFTVKLKAIVNSRMGESMAIVGPVDLKADIDVGNQRGKFNLEFPGFQMQGSLKISSVSELAGEMDLSSKMIDYSQWRVKGAGSAPITDLTSQISFRSNVVKVKSLNFKFLGGLGKGSGNLALASVVPSYDFSLSLKELDLQKAASSQSDLLKNTLTGTADFQLEGRGQGFEPTAAMKKLAGTGNLTVREAKFSNLDIGKAVEKGLGESLGKVVERVPIFGGKPISKMGPIESEYEWVKSDFKIQDGFFEAPNFEAKAKTKKGLDIKGRTRLNLETCGIDADWKIIDTYNLTKVRDVTVDQGGVKIEHILAQGSEPVSFPILVQGTCKTPKLNYEAMTAALIKVALQNSSKGIVQKATKEITKKLGEELQKGAAKPLQDALKGIFGK